MQWLPLALVVVASCGGADAFINCKYQKSIKAWLVENGVSAVHGVRRMNLLQTTYASLEVEDQQGRRAIVTLRAGGWMAGTYHDVARLVSRCDIGSP